MNLIKENLNFLLEKIADTASQCGRNSDEIDLIAVTKTVPPERINQGISAGVKIIGENKVQEAKDKSDLLDPVKCHMIGHLQTNKVKYAVKIFDMVQSVDTLKLAEEINKRCESLNTVMPILIEVNTSGEGSKFGCKPEKLEELVSEASKVSHVRIEGLMTIGLFSDDMTLVRPCFIRLRELSEKINKLNIDNVYMKHLSMGMSADYPVAIEEGATMIRIGTAIFGARSYSN
jgi:pyridoxal phosphate enzyme (YggS family)